MIEILIKWILFCIAIGVTEGGFFAYGGSLVVRPYNIHSFLYIPRAVIGGFLMWDVLPLLPWYGVPILGFAFAGMYPFFHDGALYQTRGWLDFPEYNFFSESDTTTARFSVGFEARTIMLVVSIVLYLWAYWLTI